MLGWLSFGETPDELRHFKHKELEEEVNTGGRPPPPAGAAAMNAVNKGQPRAFKKKKREEANRQQTAEEEPRRVNWHQTGGAHSQATSVGRKDESEMFPQACSESVSLQGHTASKASNVKSHCPLSLILPH